mmetsp:Transcript_24465/g.28795  ORF Transcript_24465/g.28795 Transcript_24465/m.28795 type:complete len:333 (-) Transcript_24465:150-1148(-)
MKPRIQRSVDLSSDVTGMFRRASSAETNMAVSIGSERKTKVIAEGKHDDDNDDDENDGTEIEIDTEVEIEVEKTKAIPIGSGLQAVRKVATLSAEKEKPMRTFPCFPGDGDLASLLIRLADQARYTIFNERKLDEVTMKSPFFTNLSPRFQIILLYRCIRALILPSKNSKNNDKMTHPYTATFFLDVTLHALLRTMVPGITQEIISQQENNSGFKQNAMRNDDSGGGGGDDKKKNTSTSGETPSVTPQAVDHQIHQEKAEGGGGGGGGFSTMVLAYPPNNTGWNAAKHQNPMLELIFLLREFEKYKEKLDSQHKKEEEESQNNDTPSTCVIS